MKERTEEKAVQLRLILMLQQNTEEQLALINTRRSHTTEGDLQMKTTVAVPKS